MYYRFANLFIKKVSRNKKQIISVLKMYELKKAK